MIESTPIPVGARVLLRPVHDFLTLRSAEATVLGQGNAPGLVLIRLDEPALSRFEDDEIHEVQEMSEAPEHLDMLTD